MNLPDIYDMLRDRALADSSAGGLFHASSTFKLTGWYTGVGPRDAAFPYVVQNIASNTGENTFGGDVRLIVVRFSVMTLVKNGLDTPSAILRRIYGDYTNVSGAMTHGFHRWTPTMTSSYGWSADTLQQTQPTESHDEDVFHFIDEYKFYVRRNKPA